MKKRIFGFIGFTALLTACIFCGCDMNQTGSGQSLNDVPDTAIRSAEQTGTAEDGAQPDDNLPEVEFPEEHRPEHPDGNCPKEHCPDGKCPHGIHREGRRPEPKHEGKHRHDRSASAESGEERVATESEENDIQPKEWKRVPESGKKQRRLPSPKQGEQSDKKPLQRDDAQKSAN